MSGVEQGTHQRAVVTIGTFDGVHVGHAALVERARSLAGELAAPGGVTAMVFDPHPMTVLGQPSGAGAPPRLSSFGQRERWLLALGADRVVRLRPTPELLSRSAGEFVDWCIDHHGAAGFVEGPDFRFGRGREGGTEDLRRLAGARGAPVEVVPAVEVVMTDHQTARASSTLARWLVAHGRVADAAAVLGRWFEIDALVVPGDRRGRTIGFPTANLVPASDGQSAGDDVLPPGDGVYACVGVLDDGRELPAAVNVGKRPTFAGVQRTIEAHFLGLGTSAGGGAGVEGAWRPVPGVAEYGWRVQLRFVAWLRDQVRFESVPALVAQLHRDCARAAEVVGRAGVGGAAMHMERQGTA